MIRVIMPPWKQPCYLFALNKRERCEHDNKQLFEINREFHKAQASWGALACLTS